MTTLSSGCPTGEPKGCLLSHGNVYYKGRVYLDLLAWTARDRYFAPVPVEIVAAFPLTGSGKVQKPQKAYAVEKYGLKGPA